MPQRYIVQYGIKTEPNGDFGWCPLGGGLARQTFWIIDENITQDSVAVINHPEMQIQGLGKDPGCSASTSVATPGFPPNILQIDCEEIPVDGTQLNYAIITPSETFAGGCSIADTDVGVDITCGEETFSLFDGEQGLPGQGVSISSDCTNLTLGADLSGCDLSGMIYPGGFSLTQTLDVLITVQI